MWMCLYYSSNCSCSSWERKFPWCIFSNISVSKLLDKRGRLYPFRMAFMNGRLTFTLHTHTGSSSFPFTDRCSHFHCSLHLFLTHLYPSLDLEHIMEEGSDEIRWEWGSLTRDRKKTTHWSLPLQSVWSTHMPNTGWRSQLDQISLSCSKWKAQKNRVIWSWFGTLLGAEKAPEGMSPMGVQEIILLGTWT